MWPVRDGYQFADIGSTHTIGTQFRTFHYQLSHFVDFSDTHFACVVLRRIIKPCMTELRPALEHFIDAMARRLQLCRHLKPCRAFVRDENGCLIATEGASEPCECNAQNSQPGE
jgi:hypothetical protein